MWRILGWPLPVGGGGYFRLYPYALTRRGLAAINAAGRPFAVYLHPWEFDPEQPRFAPGRLRAFRHYVNLHRTAPRLEQLLRDFRFGPVSEFNKHVVRISTREEFQRVLENYLRWREQFLDERGELKPKFQLAPMVASFMQEPATGQRSQIPVPRGPVEVW